MLKNQAMPALHIVKLTSLVDLDGLFPKIQKRGPGDPSLFGNWGTHAFPA